MRGLKKVKDRVGTSGLSPPKETTAEQGWFDEFSYEINTSYGAPGFPRPKDLCWWAELSSSRKGPVQTSPGDALSFLQLHLVIQEQALVHGLMLVATVGRSIDWRERDWAEAVLSDMLGHHPLREGAEKSTGKASSKRHAVLKVTRLLHFSQWSLIVHSEEDP